MKNAISYYYNLIPTEIHQINKMYKFKIENINYIMYQYNRSYKEIEEIYSLHLSLLNNGYYCHQIIINNNNEIITMINNNHYVLMKILIENRKINMNDILSLNNIYINDKNFLNLQRNDWYTLWANKVDYIEYQINQFGKKYTLIRESSDYFIGIVENCISLLANLKPKYSIKTISHNRINKESTIHQLYNPLNFVIDNRVRDISEYFKLQILEGHKVTENIKEYIYTSKLNEDEIVLLFIRLLYPTQYFDICEEIINNQKKEAELLKIINKIDIYETTLKDIYNSLRNIVKMPEIEWLLKM